MTWPFHPNFPSHFTIHIFYSSINFPLLTFFQPNNLFKVLNILYVFILKRTCIIIDLYLTLFFICYLIFNILLLRLCMYSRYIYLNIFYWKFLKFYFENDVLVHQLFSLIYFCLLFAYISLSSPTIFMDHDGEKQDTANEAGFLRQARTVYLNFWSY